MAADGESPDGMTVGVVDADQGQVVLGGNDCTHLPMYKRARLGMGYLPQESSVFRQMTVRDNVLSVLEAMPFGRKERHSEADRLLGELELTHLVESRADTLHATFAVGHGSFGLERGVGCREHDVGELRRARHE